MTGAVYKFGLGPKGMISGGFFGGLLGTFGGSLIYAFSKICGVSIDNLYHSAKIYFQYKDNSFQNSFKVSTLWLMKTTTKCIYLSYFSPIIGST